MYSLYAHGSYYSAGYLELGIVLGTTKEKM